MSQTKKVVDTLRTNAAIAECSLSEEALAAAKRAEDSMGYSLSATLSFGLGLALAQGADADDMHAWLTEVIANVHQVQRTLPDQELPS